MDSIDPELRAFILFCAEQSGKQWPSIYDEMARVAGQHLFKGLGYTELKQHGLSLSAFNLDEMIRLVEEVTSQDQ